MTDATDMEFLPPLSIPLVIRATAIGFLCLAACIATYAATASIMWAATSSDLGFILWVIVPFVSMLIPAALLALDGWVRVGNKPRIILAMLWVSWVSAGAVVAAGLAREFSRMAEADAPELGIGFFGIAGFALAAMVVCALVSGLVAVIWFVGRRLGPRGC